MAIQVRWLGPLATALGAVAGVAAVRLGELAATALAAAFFAAANLVPNEAPSHFSAGLRGFSHPFRPLLGSSEGQKHGKMNGK